VEPSATGRYLAAAATGPRATSAETPAGMMGEPAPEQGMYTDWTAVILLLLTAVPLAAVVATTAFFIWRQQRRR
jgi:hypothetical protein